MFCNGIECTNKCPAYVINNNPYSTCCALINAEIKANKAKEEAYKVMATKLSEVKED